MMDAVTLHMTLNHLPVLGTMFGALLLVAGLLTRSHDLRRAALIVFVLAAAAAAPVYFSGPGAEEAVEHLPDVREPLIEAHEDAALWALWGVLLLGALSVGALWAGRGRPERRLTLAVAVLVVALAVSAAMGWTAHLGGQINHPELRAGVERMTEGGDDD